MNKDNKKIDTKEPLAQDVAVQNLTQGLAKEDLQNFFRALPAMDIVLSHLEQHFTELSSPLVPRQLQKDYASLFFTKLRADISLGKISNKETLVLEFLMPQLIEFIQNKSKPHFRRVINATGVVIHTNLGRSILADAACKAVDLACRHYSNLEFDLDGGERGSRYSHVLEILQKLTGAESAVVVNNNAAAVLIVTDTLCKGREVIVSRGELVEIGGSFRIPEVIERSSCILKEVGSTNRTHLADFEQAINPETAAILKVHTSNFRIVGFHSQPSLSAIAELAHKHNIPLIKDLGSGSLCDFAELGLHNLGDEPTVQQVVNANVDVVTFSGDKVLGGPQAGIIVGKEKYIAQIRKNPLNRALRIDKMTLAALEATLNLYVDQKIALEKIPSLAMITATPEFLKKKAQTLARKLNASLKGRAKFVCVPGSSRVGGGAFPERDLPTTLLRIEGAKISPNQIKQELLNAAVPPAVPIVGRIENQAFCFDPRTLFEADYPFILQALQQCL